MIPNDLDSPITPTRAEFQAAVRAAQRVFATEPKSVRRPYVTQTRMGFVQEFAAIQGISADEAIDLILEDFLLNWDGGPLRLDPAASTVRTGLRVVSRPAD
jgi:hypothetical protein